MLDGARGDGTGESISSVGKNVFHILPAEVTWLTVQSMSDVCLIHCAPTGSRLWFQSRYMELWDHSHRVGDRLCTLSPLPSHEGEHSAGYRWMSRPQCGALIKTCGFNHSKSTNCGLTKPPLQQSCFCEGSIVAREDSDFDPEVLVFQRPKAQWKLIYLS